MSIPTVRPLILSTRGIVASGHYLASAAGLRVLQDGGNAIDAAATMCFCLCLLEPGNCGLGGEVPTLIYSARDRRTYAVSGMGWSPQAFTIDWCREHALDLIPGDGYLPACVPAVVGTWTEALARFGTLSLSEVLQPALSLARDGFPVDQHVHEMLAAQAARFRDLYPSTLRAYYLAAGAVPQAGEALRCPDWARTLELLCRAESEGARRGRLAGLQAAEDAFYRGEVAQRIASFIAENPVQDASGSEHRGLLTYEDMAAWRPSIEEPTTFHYHDVDVFKCPSWTQGPVFLQQLALLEGYDLPALGHNSVAYLHTLLECAKLAFADREAYYGDPLLDEVPFDRLLAKDYAAARRRLVSAEASRELRAGNVGRGVPEYLGRSIREDNRRALGFSADDPVRGPATPIGDTTHLDAIDRWGNMVAATPSGGWLPSSPVIEGLGFPLGTRGQMFYLNAQRPNALAPHKRPRATLTPTLTLRQGRPVLAFGTQGGDMQDQITVQFLLNVLHFGMNVQQALEAPMVYSEHFPSSFYPRQAAPARAVVEASMPAEVVEGLRQRGHEVQLVPSAAIGKAMGLAYDSQRGVFSGGATPKSDGMATALGW